MGSLGVRFEVGRGGGFNYPSPLPCLKLVTIMLKVESFFFSKYQHFLVEIVPLLKAIV